MLNCSAQCVNTDFESSAAGTYTNVNPISGCTITSQTATSCTASSSWISGSPEFSIITTPILYVPFIGILPNSPLGGSQILQLNNYTANGSVTRFTQTLSISSLNLYFQFAYAGIWEDGGSSHQCCEQAGFTVRVKDNLGVYSTCPSYTLGGANCQNVPTYSVTAGTTWTSWQVKYIDFTQYNGTTITLEVTANDCTMGTHYGTVFFDSGCMAPFSGPCTCFAQTIVAPISFCTGSSVAMLPGPLGFQEYQWIAPVGYPITTSQSTLASLTVTNALAGNIYTLNLNNPDYFCSLINTYTLTTSTISIVGIGTSSSCAAGASGSATVVAAGSSLGYNYLWVNASNSVVSTSATATNLSPGNYSLTVFTPGSSSLSCGMASTVIPIASGTPGVTQILKAYCGNEAYMCSNGGTTFQWYNNLSPISSSITSSSPCYTVNNPTNGSIYRVSNINLQGCPDSLVFTLVASAPGHLSISYNPIICLGANNGTVILTMTPAPSSSPSSIHTFSLYSVGITPAYSASLISSGATTFTATNLSAGNTYSINAFDGACKYTTSVSIQALTFDYAVNPTSSTTLCAGNNLAANVSFSIAPAFGEYTYSWTPSQFLFGVNNPNIIISPSLPQGSVTTIVYTVIVTPTLAPCPISKTLSVTVANLITPTLSPIPLLCNDLTSSYTISANPTGGIYSNNNAITSNGILNGALGAIGQNSFTYAISVGTCVAKTSGTFTINNLPVISVSGNTVICNGNSTTLLTSGANTYTWNTNVSGPVVLITPTTTSSYIVSGTDALTTCSATKTVTINVLSNPVLSISGNTVLCAGETITLAASGADTYLWNNGSANSIIFISPTASANYTLIGTNTVGSCTSSEIITILVSSCTELNKTKPVQELIIYPNPTNGKFFIETSQEVAIFISDPLGKIILEQKLEKGNHSLDLSNYANGIYFLKTMYNGETKIIKLIKKD